MIGRRGILGGLVTSWWAAGNARTPQGPQARESQRPDRRPLGQSRAGVGPAPSQGTFIGRLVVVSGTGPGVGIFVYNGAPGPGTLVESITQASTDPYTNHTIPGGDAVYNNAAGVAVLFGSNGMRSYHGSLAGGWTLFSSSGVTFDSTGDVNVAANANLTLSAAAGVAHPTTLTLLGGGLTLNSGAWQIVMPSGDTTGVIDTAAINNALGSTAPAVLLLPGIYYVNAPLIMPSSATRLYGFGGTGNPSANFGGGGLPMAITVLQAVSGFTGAAMIEMASSGSQTGGHRIEGLALDGSAGPGAINAIQALGWVAQVKLRDIAVYGGTSHKFTYGLLLNSNADGNPDAWDVDACAFQFCNTACVGILTGVSDSFWRNVSCTASATDAWKIINGASSRFLFCKGETSAGFGFNIQGVTGFTGFLEFTNCSGEINTTGDFSLSGTGTGTFYFDFCHGRSATPWTYAGTNNVRSPAAYNVSTAAPTLN